MGGRNEAGQEPETEEEYEGWGYYLGVEADNGGHYF